MARAGLDKDPHDIAQMFDGVAAGYDRTNTVMTLGFDRRWREQTRRVLDARPGEAVLDLAAGTAVSTVEYARSGAWCVAADFSLPMLHGGAARGVPRVAADAFHLPFATGAFDAVTVSFGLRNMVPTVDALAEMLRVVRPGGRLVVCEVSQPPLRPVRWLYHNTVLRALPLVTKPFSSNTEAYSYLAESMRDWHDQRSVAEMVAKAGWTEVEWRNLTFGVVALHRAVKP
ncbi:demethylmenaquinone methyltransferase [Actinokineospora bangkokensis]|uniref:Demethylmenaquinone methyltransferase n=1 Tax=Actinokineospora bangkokensis TaxID=1193682 RepID=A0A1Q9LFC2_9PSEU|nr:demethylmenaquinone methyltransferase [Actinokineospora bangkokensis]OLR90705.1 bifunctional demethylmenaquinone methyltransferase/2-methoxy-6-polyprenyl-1,4-benzoquinol methylase [Actinokineospora bangkokensis]